MKRRTNHRMMAGLFVIILVPGSAIATLVCAVGTIFALLTPDMLLPCAAVTLVLGGAFLRMLHCCRNIWNGSVQIKHLDVLSMVALFAGGATGFVFMSDQPIQFFYPDIAFRLAAVAVAAASILIPLYSIYLKRSLKKQLEQPAGGDVLKAAPEK